MTHETTYTRKFACSSIGLDFPQFDRAAECAQARNGGFRPEPFAKQLLYGVAELAALYRQQVRIANDGWTMKLAGEEAQRLHRAMTAHPEADRIALVTLENSNRFAANADQLDLASGYSSGAAVRETLVIDVRNLRARIASIIEAAVRIVGEAADDS